MKIDFKSLIGKCKENGLYYNFASCQYEYQPEQQPFVPSYKLIITTDIEIVDHKIIALRHLLDFLDGKLKYFEIYKKSLFN